MHCVMKILMKSTSTKQRQLDTELFSLLRVSNSPTPCRPFEIARSTLFSIFMKLIVISFHYLPNENKDLVHCNAALFPLFNVGCQVLSLASCVVGAHIIMIAFSDYLNSLFSVSVKGQYGDCRGKSESDVDELRLR